MKRLILVSLLFTSGISRAELSLLELNERLSQRGPRVLLQELAYPYERWDELLAKIGSGDNGWVQLGLDLYPVSDAGGSFTLGHALAKAYSRNPAAFTTDPKLAAIVCDSSYYELATFDEAKQYVADMNKILTSMASGQEFKDKCAERIAKLEANLTIWNGEKP